MLSKYGNFSLIQYTYYRIIITTFLGENLEYLKQKYFQNLFDCPKLISYTESPKQSISL